jgi:HK97 family phage portal protein
MWNPLRLFNRGRSAVPNPALAVRPFTAIPTSLYVTLEQALNQSGVYKCINLISNAIAESSFLVYSVKDGVREWIPEDPADDLLNYNPCPEMLPAQIKRWLVRDMLAEGTGYAELVRAKGGQVTQIIPLYANRMSPILEGDYCYYQYVDDLGDVINYRPEQLLIATDERPGESRLRRALRAAGLSKAQEDFALSFFANGMNIGGYIETPAGLNPKQQQQLLDAVEGRTGVANANSTPILPFGAKYNQLNSNAQQAQLLESRRFSVVEIARFFGVHPCLAGDEASSNGYGANIVAFRLDTYDNGILPIANALSEALTRSFFPMRSRKVIDVDLEWYKNGGRQALAAAQSQDLGDGVLSVNEARAERGMAGIGPAGDEHRVSVKETPADGPAEMGKEPGPANPPGGEPKPPLEDPAKKGNQEKALLNGATFALERHARRCAARKADLQKAGKSEEEIFENLTALYSRGAEDLSYLLEIIEANELRAALDSVCAGIEPQKAARHLLGL